MDAIQRTVVRKAAIDAARAALRTGGVEQMRAAFKALPKVGQKADSLRGLLSAALAGAREVGSGREGRATTVRSVCDEVDAVGEGGDRPVVTTLSDGVTYVFRLAELGNMAFFTAKSEGAQVVVTVNTLHAFGLLAEAEHLLDTAAVQILLAAWATYELELGAGPLQRRARNSRVDWGRVVRRLLLARKSG